MEDTGRDLTRRNAIIAGGLTVAGFAGTPAAAAENANVPSAMLKTVDLTPLIGTEIHTDVKTLLSGAATAEIRRLLEARGSLVIRGINLTDSQQTEFAKTFGEIEDEGATSFAQTSILSTFQHSTGYFHPGADWHSAGIVHRPDVPCYGSMMSVRRVPRIGGQSVMANTYAAYDDLPESEKKQLDTLRVTHTNPGSQTPARNLPLVWKRRSGRKSLLPIVSSSAIPTIDGMSCEEGRALLHRVFTWTTQPKYCYMNQFRVGDLTMWDNTGTLQRMLPFIPDEGGAGHEFFRTTLAGVEPLV